MDDRSPEPPRRRHALLARLCLAAVLAVPASCLLQPGGPGQAFARDGGGHGGSGGGGSGNGGSWSGSSGHGGGSSGHGGESGDDGSSGPGGRGSDEGSGGRHGEGRGDASGSQRSGDRVRGSDGGRSAVVWSRQGGGAVEVRYGDGWSERADATSYTLRDPARRVVASRPARRGDLRRLRMLAE